MRELPLWAQVALATRCVRRAALAAGGFLSTAQVGVLIAGCDALDRAASAGERAREDQAVLVRAASLQPPVRGGELVSAMQSAVDAAAAAEAASDLAAAESACLESVRKAIARTASSLGLASAAANALVASEGSALKAACARERVGRYDALGARVPGALPPLAVGGHVGAEGAR